VGDGSKVTASEPLAEEHYVYLYRDDFGRVCYVGYGRRVQRASSHLLGSHNDELNRFLLEQKYRIEIAGPFESEQTGRAVETAMISALKPKFNVDPGANKWRFRPLGVPLDYAERLVERELVLRDFLVAQGLTPSPVLFVIVTDVDLAGDRVGYNPASPPTDAQIQARVDRWWQLHHFVPGWRASPKDSPGLLVGVFGSPGRQIVIASARIDRSCWERAEDAKGGKISVPLIEPVDLDAFHLRGRRIARAAGLMFGGIPAQFYILLGANGVAVGGHHLRKRARLKEP
jgi:hypothetical protein